MATVIDLLRHLGHNAAPDGGNALAGPIMLPGVSDSPLALPLPPALVDAWTRTVGRRTLGHHALALSTAQSNSSVALMGHGIAPNDDLLLLLFGHLVAQPNATGICLLPTTDAPLRSKITTLADLLKIRWIDAAQPGQRVQQARLVLATPNDLHRRVLRFHDRAWRWLWPQLEVLALPYAHTAMGIAAGHVQWLVRRIERLAPRAPLQILSALASVANADAALSKLLDRSSRVVAAPDGPEHATLIALWRAQPDRMASLRSLIDQLIARRLALTVLGRSAAETQRLRAELADRGVLLAPDARVAVVFGLPPTSDARHALLRSGYRLLIILMGDEPHELLWSAAPELLLHALPHWPLAVGNPYVITSQLSCAAAERPLDVAEVDRWNVRDVRDRLLKKHTLQALPDHDTWQIAPNAADPHASLDMRTIGGVPSTIIGPDQQPIETLAPALLDRRALPDQVYAPGLRVARRDDDTQTVQLRDDPQQRATLPLTTSTITVREELAARTAHIGKTTLNLIKGRVLAVQQINGLRELHPDGTQRRVPIQPALDLQWSAAACWIELPAAPPDPATAGWAVTQAIPLLTLAAAGSITPAYDAEHQRLYLVETEPGGSGVINCVYDEFDRLIELATALATACASRPLYARVARADHMWLRALNDDVAPLAAEQPTAPPVAPVAVDAARATPAMERTQPAAPPFARPRIAPQLAPRPALRQQAEHAATARHDVDQPPITGATDQPPALPAENTPDPAPPRRRAGVYVSRQQPAASIEPAPMLNRQIEPAPIVAPPIALVVPAPIEHDTDQIAPRNEDETDQIAPAQPADDRRLEEPVVIETIAPVVDYDAAAVAVQDVSADQAPDVFDHATPQQTEQSVDGPAAAEGYNAASDDGEQAVDAPQEDVAWEPLVAVEAPAPVDQAARPAARQYRINDLLPPLEDDEPNEEPAAAETEPAVDEEHAPATTPLGQPEQVPDPSTPAPSRERPFERRQPEQPAPPNAQPPHTTQRPRYSPQVPRRNAPPARRPAPAEQRTDPSTQRPQQAPPRFEPRRTEPQRPPERRPSDPARPERRDQSPRPQPPGFDRAGSRASRPNAPSQRNEPRPAPRPAPRAAPEPDPPADVNAMIERMRRLRQQREAEQRPQAPAATPRSAPKEPLELRFHIGERVQCLPYGIGIVQASRISGGREQVVINFPEYGEIEVDPAVSLVRQLPPDEPPATDDDT